MRVADVRSAILIIAALLSCLQRDLHAVPQPYGLVWSQDTPLLNLKGEILEFMFVTLALALLLVPAGPCMRGSGVKKVNTIDKEI